MRKHILILLLIILFCGFGIALPYFTRVFSERKADKDLQLKNQEIEKMISSESSNSNTILELEPSFSDIESESYDKDQVYVNGIDELYSYFTINQVEDIRQRIQFHIKQNINKTIKKGTIDRNSIVNDNVNINFSVIAGSNVFEVRVTKNKSPMEIYIIQ